MVTIDYGKVSNVTGVIPGDTKIQGFKWNAIALQKVESVAKIICTLLRDL